jgi:hypothetical protein
MTDYREMLPLDNPALARVDPLVRNLLVARSIPALANLDVPRYQATADGWAEGVRSWLPRADQEFHKSPEYWKNDINFFRLGVVHQYLEREVGVEYIEEQRQSTRILYTNPSDLFLNGVMDTKRGTCGNMAALHVAIGWRLGWPVSLACVGSHFLCRYDDGKVTHNIEATQSGHGGFKSDPDEYLIEHYGLPPVAVACGSDLRALSPREMLGMFVGLRARHMRDTGRWHEAQQDYLLARWLFPNSRRLYIDGMCLAIGHGNTLFVPGEVGSPHSLTDMLVERYRPRWARPNPIIGQSETITSLDPGLCWRPS